MERQHRGRAATWNVDAYDIQAGACVLGTLLFGADTSPERKRLEGKLAETLAESFGASRRRGHGTTPRAPFTLHSPNGIRFRLLRIWMRAAGWYCHQRRLCP